MQCINCWLELEKYIFLNAVKQMNQWHATIRTCSENGLLLLCCAVDVDIMVAHNVCTITNSRHILTIFHKRSTVRSTIQLWRIALWPLLQEQKNKLESMRTQRAQMLSKKKNGNSLNLQTNRFHCVNSCVCVYKSRTSAYLFQVHTFSIVDRTSIVGRHIHTHFPLRKCSIFLYRHRLLLSLFDLFFLSSCCF